MTATGLTRSTAARSVARLVERGDARRRSPKGRILATRQPAKPRSQSSAPGRKRGTRGLHARPPDERHDGDLRQLHQWVVGYPESAAAFAAVLGTFIAALITVLARRRGVQQSR